MDNRWITPTVLLTGITSLSVLAAAGSQDLGVRPDSPDGIGIDTTHPIPNALDFPHAEDRVFVRFKADATDAQRAEIYDLIGPALQSFSSVEDLVCIKHRHKGSLLNSCNAARSPPCSHHHARARHQSPDL